MNIKKAFILRYNDLLHNYVHSPDEKYLVEVETLGQEMVIAKLPPEEVGEMHDLAISKLIESCDIDAKHIRAISLPLMQLLMAYGMAFRSLQEKKEAEARLHLASRAIENTMEGIIITDAKGMIIDTNRAFEHVTGYSKEEALGNTPSMLSSGKQDAEFYQSMWQSLAQNGQWHGKIWNRRKCGEVYPEHLSITAIYNDDGVITNHVGVFSDITEQISLEEQLLQAQKMEAIGTLVGGIAHDFNNMLAGITGNLYLAKKKAIGMPKLIAKLDNIEQLSFRSASMISQLLTFARKGIVDMQSFSLQTFVREALKLSKVSVPENINFHYDIANDPCMVHGDMTQLQQVMINLLNNAHDAVVDASEPEIELKLFTYTADTSFRQKYPDVQTNQLACLSVRDNGHGIAKEHLAHVFEPFFTTKEVGKGTGLGLAMCYGAAQSHHGVITLNSQLGVGTEFQFYLPLISATANERDATVLSKLAQPDGQTILLADDEQHVRETTAEVLESLGYKVLQANDGLKAIELFKSHQDEVCLAILDVVMPNLGGMDLAKRIRAINSKVPLIFMTGYDKEHVLDASERMEHCEILTKPVNFDTINHRIQTLLA